MLSKQGPSWPASSRPVDTLTSRRFSWTWSFFRLVLTLSRWQQRYLGRSDAINLDDNVICVCIIVIQGCARLSHAPHGTTKLSHAFFYEFNLCLCWRQRHVCLVPWSHFPPLPSSEWIFQTYFTLAWRDHSATLLELWLFVELLYPRVNK